MQVKGIADCSKGSILHYFRPSLSYHLSLISLFVHFEWPLKTGFTVYQNMKISPIDLRVHKNCLYLTLCVLANSEEQDEIPPIAVAKIKSIFKD